MRKRAGCSLLLILLALTLFAIGCDAYGIDIKAGSVEPLLSAPRIMQGYFCSYTYAKTPDYFFFGNTRASLGDLSSQKLIPIPIAFHESSLKQISYCGITEHHLYANAVYSAFLVTYKISIQSLGIETLLVQEHSGGLYSEPWYNSQSNCLLYMPQDGRCILEALDLETGEASTIYSGDDLFYELSTRVHWYDTSEGQVAFEVVSSAFGHDGHGFALIGANNEVTLVSRAEFATFDRWEQVKPGNEAEKNLIENGYSRFQTCGSYVYYLESQNSRSLNRMRPDGSDKRTIGINTDIYQLISANGMLFGLKRTKLENHADSMLDYECALVALDSGGQETSLVFLAHEGTDMFIAAHTIGGMVAVVEHIAYGSESGYLLCIFDPQSGALLAHAPYSASNWQYE
ncbi:MAG: hypothetical protein FWG30_05115 [Eubacteriaceae bacterium]|nr:hypothetical protein [Eubacteriaceae bacterium]